MAKLRSIVHSQDACTMIFHGNKRTPEPTLGVIKFPGGHIEVSRCSDDSYYVHLSVENEVNIIASRIDYNHKGREKNGIPGILDQEKVKHIAIRIKPIVLEFTGE